MGGWFGCLGTTWSSSWRTSGIVGGRVCRQSHASMGSSLPHGHRYRPVCIRRHDTLYRTCITHVSWMYRETLCLYRIIWYMNVTPLIHRWYHHDTYTIHLTDTRTIRGHAIGRYGNLVHVRYIDDTKTIQKDDTSFSIRLRYWSKVCTIHITIQNTIHFLRKFSIHTRYMNDTKLTKIGSVSRARYTAQHPPKQRFCIECVSKCIEHAFARWIQLWIHVRYGYDTSSIRYDTSYRENAPWFIGKKARHPDLSSSISSELCYVIAMSAYRQTNGSTNLLTAASIQPT